MSNAERIKELLLNSNLSFAEIAAKVGVTSKTVQNINKGKTHFNKNDQYPLRMTGREIGNLRDRMVKPNASAVPNSHVFSPQLLDYIGFLSILGADISCLLTFKEVYIHELEEIFGRSITDKEVLSIIEMNPKYPTQLNKMIKAYNDPSVKLLNTDYWIVTGIISKQEGEMIESLLI